MYKKTIIVIVIAIAGTGTLAITTAATFFGIPFKPEISISDIAAIAALISSALIFWFGYVRTRKSEQIKISTEFVNRIDSKTLKLLQLRDTRDSKEKTQEILNTMYDLEGELEYFGYLLKTHEISDEKILKYCIPKVQVAFMAVEQWIDSLKKFGAVLPNNTPNLDDQQSVLDRIKDPMRVWLKKYGIDLSARGIDRQ